jgi:transcriptional regulator with XRE-family HTH domain
MSHTIYSSPLLAHVQKAVRERPATITARALAKDCEVTPQWLSKFMNGRCENPSAILLERLYVRCTGKQLVSNDALS